MGLAELRKGRLFAFLQSRSAAFLDLSWERVSGVTQSFPHSCVWEFRKYLFGVAYILASWKIHKDRIPENQESTVHRSETANARSALGGGLRCWLKLLPCPLPGVSIRFLLIL